MKNTLYYDITLKKKKSPEEVFEKLAKSTGKPGATKKWLCTVSGEVLEIDFCREDWGKLVMTFDGGRCTGKVSITVPSPEELTGNPKKSPYIALITMLYGIRRLCSDMSVRDDFGKAEEVFRDMDYKVKLRCLTDEEKSRLDRLFNLGYTSSEDFLIAVFAEDMGLPEDFSWEDYIFCGIHLMGVFPFISSVCELYLWRTSLLENRTLKKIYEDEYSCSDDSRAEVYGFALGVGALFRSYGFIENT